MKRISLVLLFLCACSDPTIPPQEEIETPPIYTPRWAFEPWISKDISDTQDTYDFVEGFRSRDIPIGVVVLDSPWETNYNTFVPNPERYPDFAKLIADLHADNIRLVVWMTQMVNDGSFDLEPGGDTYRGASPNYKEALDNNYFVNAGERFIWWKGTGGAVDFFNDDARAWWHRQQDPLFELGLDGFKLDFGDSYIMTATVTTAAGALPHQAYSERYYEDFYAYGVHKRGRENFVTMVRPYDESYTFPGRFFAKKEHAPVGWVGDNRRDYIGLEDALDHIFRSARAGYVVVGSDIGGYLDRDDKDLTQTIPFDVEVFARWTAVSALMPFMQLHGRANITPWTVPERTEEIVALYRDWSKLHSELVPFFYSLAQEAYAGGENIIRPIGGAGDYTFQVGDAFLVAPILDATGIRNITLPAGARWIDFNNEPATAQDGGTTITYDATPIEKLPLFIREGAIIPRGDTIYIYPGDAVERFVLHDEDGGTTIIEASRTRVSFSRDPIATKIRVRNDDGSVRELQTGAPFIDL
jgi:alpha-glucosidase (family GH31 glycosyl hydrolase)